MNHDDDGNHRNWLWYAVLVWCAVLYATALGPLLPVNWWWIRIGDYPRLQLLFVYTVTLLILALYRRRWLTKWLMGMMLVGCLIQVYWIFPYLPFAPESVQSARSDDPAKRLRIVSMNVLQENENAQAVIDIVRRQQPDLLVLCEVNDRWMDDLESLDDQFAFVKKHPLENKYGIALYTNLEVLSCRVRGLVKDDIPSIDASVRLRNGQPVRVFAIHPNPPRPGESTAKRDAELVLVGREVADDQSAIVLGDMNDVGWSRTTDLFQEVSGMLDPREGRGFFSTFDATSWFMRYPLDYLFHSDDFRVVQLQTLEPIGSDHFPLMIELSHEPDARRTQEAPELDAGDKADADQAVEAAK
ncbi:Endonuclease/Exonuclease/phosphatase family protein [Rubripirellula lacrimiformis]|uniref:Endonuclease/Exonuclease/phosphatase family protein n=2 Tax=Rubripirellula lacrimiformis TaxID=1930273 RepID=A0A517NJA3_9BACT|nr:Endonuclease/Exonuclease/phosphatase family protein [Rubripirellula lacrimiformis]